MFIVWIQYHLNSDVDSIILVSVVLENLVVKVCLSHRVEGALHLVTAEMFVAAAFSQLNPGGATMLQSKK